MNNIHDYNQIKDTKEFKDSYSKAIRAYLRDDLPPEVKEKILEFVDHVIKISSNEFVCIKCLEKYRMSGFQAHIL